MNQLPGKINYFIGNDPSRWLTDVPHYSGVRYEGVYPGVDLVYYGNQRQLEYDFVVAPGADARVIRMAFGGALGLRVERDGDLVLKLKGGEVRQHKPLVYQEEEGGQRKPVAGRYVLTGRREVGFAVGEYDRGRPLVIDPVISYSTFLGGTSGDEGDGVAVDSSNNIYVLGSTSSADFPKVNPIQSTVAGSYDMFVTKLNAAGTSLVYSTYIGGNDSDVGGGIALDPSNNVYVAGKTWSTNFPVANALQPNFAGGDTDAFVLKLNSAGSALVYSTYLGGSMFNNVEGAAAIAVDAAGNAYVGGTTLSNDFPLVNPYQATRRGSDEAFLTKINAAGTALVFSTYLGGSDFDHILALALDAAGNIYVTGLTWSESDFPLVNAYQPTLRGSNDAFVAQFDPTGSSLVFSTFLGGAADEEGDAIGVDAAGNIYVAGGTDSADFPTLSAYQTAIGGAGREDVFVSKFAAGGAPLIYSTYLGGTEHEFVNDMAVDTDGSVYVAGETWSRNLPLALPLQSLFGGGFRDAYVSKIGPSGSTLPFSTYLGGASDEMVIGLTLDAAGSLYLAGITGSSTFPVTANAYQPTNRGNYDGFLTKITGVRTNRIEGVITDALGGGLASVTVTLSGSKTGTAQTNAGGYYSFPSLDSGGNYTLTPSKSPYIFLPASQTFNNLSADQRADFTVRAYSIGGRVADAGGAATAGVTVSLTGTQAGTTLTDANGNYSFPSVAAGGSYTLTPAKPDPLLTYSFTPVNRAYTNLAANQTGADFTALATTVAALNPTADAYVQDGAATANTNYGKVTPLQLRTDRRTDNGLNRDAYFKFDLSGVTRRIDAVKLRFRAALSEAGSVNTAAYPVADTTWAETGITWNNKPARGATALASINITSVNYTTYDIDVTNYVKGEKLAGRNVVSLALHDPSQVTPNVTIDSREAATNKPQLVITTSNSNNAAPTVSLTGPAGGAAYTAPASIALAAAAADSDGTVTKVEFYAGTTLLGTSNAAPYQFTWANVPAGSYALTAVATDNGGLTTQSGAAVVTVSPPNSPPSVTLNAPVSGATYSAGAAVALRADASDADGSITKVEFFAGATLVGTVTTPVSGSTYAYTWNNAPTGAHALTARATDNGGGVTTSAAVSVSVVGQTGLSPTADAYVRDGSSASANFGTATELQTQAGASGSNRETYLKFDLAQVTGVTRATLRLYGRLSDATAANVPAAVYSVAATSWVESGSGSITFNNKPAAGATPLATTTVIDNTPRWYEWDVTTYVKNAGSTVISLAVKNTSASAPYATFNSREAADRRPQLALWTTQARGALLVTSSTTLTGGDPAVKARLESLGFVVTVKAAGTNNNAVKPTDADGKSLVVISSTVTPANVTNVFRYVAVPVVNWEFDILDDMGMTGTVSGTDYGTTASQTQLTIADAAHPLAAGLSGNVTAAASGSFTWGKPNANAARVATILGDATRFAVFGYEAGAAMPGLAAPARRVALFMTDATASSFSANPAGGALFDAAVRWATDPGTAPSISGLSPTLGPVGTVVTVSGVNFGASQGTSTLTFNGVAAAPTVWGDRTIVAAVPAYATTGPVVVTVKGVASVGIVFAVGETDSDGDGLPDSWELQYFGNLNQTAAGDQDGDGLTNLQEYQQGRNPTKNALSDNGDFVNLQVHTPLAPAVP